VVVVVVVVVNIIINEFEKNIITIEKNHKFDLKGKIKNYMNFEKKPMLKVEGPN